MLNVASQRNVPPYWAVTAGPKSHSPAPTAEPATRTPGPIRLGPVSPIELRRRDQVADLPGHDRPPPARRLLRWPVELPVLGIGAIVQAITPAMALFRAGINSLLNSSMLRSQLALSSQS